MGQVLTCARSCYEHEFLSAVQNGELETIESLLSIDPQLIRKTTAFDRLSALHVAAASGQLEVLSMLMGQFEHPDLVNRHKQTPLMLAAMHGRTACVEKLLQAGANILMFDSLHGRTCLHYTAYYGHADCLLAILLAAISSPVADSWGFARFVNVRDGKGATPLHLAARQRRPHCVRILLGKGALVSALTGGYVYRCPGNTPLHLAARGGCLDCVGQLLAWGADRLQEDSSGRIPYAVALRRNHGACASLLNPSAAEPLVWPSPLKFISELNPDAKLLLENALVEANRQRGKKILKGASYSLPPPAHSDDSGDDNLSKDHTETELCYICFDLVCTIEVQDCGHQMCAHCTLALCCHNKPDPTTLCLPEPACPFCRNSIARLVVAKSKAKEEVDKNNHSLGLRRIKRSLNFGAGSSSFRGLSSAMGSFGKLSGCGSGRIADSRVILDKL